MILRHARPISTSGGRCWTRERQPAVPGAVRRRATRGSRCALNIPKLSIRGLWLRARQECLQTPGCFPPHPYTTTVGGAVYVPVDRRGRCLCTGCPGSAANAVHVCRIGRCFIHLRGEGDGGESGRRDDSCCCQRRYHVAYVVHTERTPIAFRSRRGTRSGDRPTCGL